MRERAPVTVEGDMLLSDNRKGSGTCQNGRLPSSPYVK